MNAIKLCRFVLPVELETPDDWVASLLDGRRFVLQPIPSKASLFNAAPDLLAFAKQVASEYARCDGDGLISLHFPGVDTIAEFDADDQPCDECAEVRALIKKAETP